VSLLALGGWLRFSFRETPVTGYHRFAPYILIIVLSLILNTSRYWSGYSSFLRIGPAYFAFPANRVVWFILFVHASSPA